jgi:hypothetical protein
MSGIPQAELAYRWTAYHSSLNRQRGDAMLIGASSLLQLQQTLEGLKRGALPSDVVEAIDGIWSLVEHDAGFDNFNLNSFHVADVPDFKAIYDKAHEGQKFPVQAVSEQTTGVI